MNRQPDIEFGTEIWSVSNGATGHWIRAVPPEPGKGVRRALLIMQVGKFQFDRQRWRGTITVPATVEQLSQCFHGQPPGLLQTHSIGDGKTEPFVAERYVFCPGFIFGWHVHHFAQNGRYEVNDKIAMYHLEHGKLNGGPVMTCLEQVKLSPVE